MARRKHAVPEVDGIDVDFQPADYWEVSDALSAISQDIAGQNRRDMIADVVSGKSLVPLGELADELLEATLDDESRQSLGALHPSFLGGEFLPGRRTGETEIARIVLESVTRDVLSVRARRSRNGRLRYHLVDEYEERYALQIASSAHPLTMRQLVHLIDTASGESTHDELPLIEGILWWQIDGGSEMDAEELAAFAEVESVFYPRLGEYYAKRLRKWCTEQLAERADAEWAGEDEDEDD